MQSFEAASAFLTFDRLVSSMTISRDTQAYIKATVDDPATVTADGFVRVTADNTGSVLGEVVSDYVGKVTINATKDDASASVDKAGLTVGSLDLAARTTTSYTASAKSVDNDVTGKTSAKISKSTVHSSSGGASLLARDDTALLAMSVNLIAVPETPLVTITSAHAINALTRNVEASITESGVTATGDVAVTAAGDARIVARSDSVSLRDKGNPNLTIRTLVSNAKGVAATLAVNVLLGGVDAHIPTARCRPTTSR